MLIPKLRHRRASRPKPITWHVAPYLIPIEVPQKGSELRTELSFISGTNRPGMEGSIISQFMDRSTERVLERHKVLLTGSQLLDMWYLLSDREEETKVAIGDHLYEGRYTVTVKKKTPKKKSAAPKQPKPSDHPRARKALLFEKYSPTAVARLMGSKGFTPTEALHVLTELGVKTTLTSMRTFCYAGKKGERGDLPALTKDEVGKLEALRKTAPAPVAGGGRARMSIWGHPATAVLRWMGKQRFTKDQALAALEDLKRDSELDKLPSPASISIFLQAGRTGRRGEPAKLTADQEKKLLGYRTDAAVGVAKKGRQADALAKAKAAAGGKLPVKPGVPKKAAAAPGTQEKKASKKAAAPAKPRQKKTPAAEATA